MTQGCIMSYPLHKTLHNKSNRISRFLNDFNCFLMGGTTKVNPFNFKDTVTSLFMARKVIREQRHHTSYLENLNAYIELYNKNKGRLEDSNL